jgi:hypothetical protein
LQWIKRYIFFHGKRHPKEMGEAEVQAFLTHLAADRLVAASTQNQALGRCCSCIKRCWGGNWILWRDLTGRSGGSGCRWC